jgi:hypothetical protein
MLLVVQVVRRLPRGSDAEGSIMSKKMPEARRRFKRWKCKGFKGEKK